MFRNVILTALCLLVNAGHVRADESPMTVWMKYLEGQWTYEISDGRLGDAEWTLKAGGKSLIGNFSEEDTTAVEIGGSLSGTKIGMFSGYDSKGNHWKAEYKSLSAKGGRGPIFGKTDGNEYSGDLETTIVSQDQWEWTIKGKTSTGEEMNLSATFKRVPPPEIAAEESERWLKFFAGNWHRERELWTGDEKTVDTATWTSELAADGKVLVETGTWDKSGATWVMISGSGSHKFHFERGIDSSGINWSIDYRMVDDKTLRGTSGGVAEGEKFEGETTLTMTGKDSYEATWEAKLANGEIVKAKATNTRIK